MIVLFSKKHSDDLTVLAQVYSWG